MILELLSNNINLLYLKCKIIILNYILRLVIQGNYSEACSLKKLYFLNLVIQWDYNETFLLEKIYLF